MQTGSFSVTDPFLTTFYYVDKLNGILRKNRGERFENLTCPYMGMITERPLRSKK